ncbi:MAG TPA: dienelactone hydrolase family protein [Rariglobus sp.]|jgi:dienelactone hydrolase|nr:dienelactone hydrolase family protein [Rariglobus sp.]
MKYASLLLLSCLGALTSAHAALVTKPVAYEQAGVKLEGYLAYDDAKVSAEHLAPGVLVVHEWWGLNAYAKGKAEALAKLGYVAFALDMYGAGVNTEDPKKAGELATPFYGKPLMAERARAGLDQLLATGLVDPRKVAAIGFCFGGSTVQALAYSGAPLAGIVSFHGGPVVPTPEQAQAIKGKFLICNGAIDPLVKPDDLHALLSALDEAKVDYEFVSYAGALHAFTNPDATRLAKATGLPIGYNEKAARRSWQHMQDFFGEIFAE